MGGLRFASPGFPATQQPSSQLQQNNKNYARNMQMLNEIKSKLPINQLISGSEGGAAATSAEIKLSDQYQQY